MQKSPDAKQSLGKFGEQVHVERNGRKRLTTNTDGAIVRRLPAER